MSDSVIKTEKKQKNGKHLLTEAGPGRPKGSLNKITKSAKENIEKAFDDLGGVEGFIKWAKKSNYNMTKVYDWYFSMLPKNVDAKVGGDLVLTVNRIISDEKITNGTNKNGNGY